MRTTLLILAIALSVSACAGRVQFNSETDPYPDDYRAIAERALTGTPDTENAALTISAPRLMVGETVGDPQRWYVCVRGIPTRQSPPDGLKPLFDAVAQAVNPPAQSGVFDVILILRPDQPPFRLEAFDADLCRDGAFEPFTL